MSYEVTLWQLMGGRKWRKDLEFSVPHADQVVPYLVKQGFYVDTPVVDDRGVSFTDLGSEYLAEVVER